jgi:hypothetical protein
VVQEEEEEEEKERWCRRRRMEEYLYSDEWEGHGELKEWKMR